MPDKSDNLDVDSFLDSVLPDEGKAKQEQNQAIQSPAKEKAAPEAQPETFFDKARTKENPSAHGSGNISRTEGTNTDVNSSSLPSVKEEIKKIRAELKEKAQSRKREEPQRSKSSPQQTTRHRQPQSKKKDTRAAGRQTVQTAKKSAKTGKQADKTIETSAKYAKHSVKTAEKSAKAAVKIAQRTAKTTQKTAQASKAATNAAVKTAKTTTKAVIATVKATVAAVKGTVSLIVAGGWVRELLSSEYNDLWAALLGGYSPGNGEIGTPDGSRIPKGIFSWPIGEGFSITSFFGYRKDPFTGETKYHGGIDIGTSEGTPILAAADGIVTVANSTDSWGGGYGYFVRIAHDGGYTSLYAHCSRIAVTNSQEVKKGEIIAFVGSTGRSTGNHLHFEVSLDGSRTNPLVYFE